MEEIYKEYAKLVYNYLYGLCENPNIAEDLTQETFFKAIKGLNSFNNKSKISTWLCQIAKNCYLDFLRKSKGQISTSIYDENYISSLIFKDTFEDELENKEELITLYKYIHNLDDETKEVFYLRLKGELSFKDIGKILNKSENWARFTFYKGKIKLKEDMNNEKRM